MQYYTQSKSGISHSSSPFTPCVINPTLQFQTSLCELCTYNQCITITSFECTTCQLSCCLTCFNRHFNERVTDSIRQLKKNFSSSVNTYLEYHGNFVMDETCPELPKLVEVSQKTYTTDLNDMEAVAKSLKSLPCRSQMKFSFDQALKCMYFQDEQMGKVFEYNNQFISLTKVCHCVDSDWDVYAFVSQDANGHCEIVGICLFSKTDDASLSWLCKTFKKNHPSWFNICILFIDYNEIINKDILESNFSKIRIMTLSSQALHTFESYLIGQDIEENEKQIAVRMFRGLVLSCNDTDYNSFYQLFRELCPSLTDYFESFWHPIKNSWTLACEFSSSQFMQPMSDFLAELVQTCEISLQTKNLPAIIETLYSLVLSIRMKHCQNISLAFQIFTSTYPVFSLQQTYAHFLTSYAAKLTFEQFVLLDEVNNYKIISRGKYQIKESGKIFFATSNHCSCSFYNVVLLPCCHIYAVRKQFSLPLFDNHLCAIQWHANSYQKYFLCVHSETFPHISSANPDNSFQDCIVLARNLLLLFGPDSNIVTDEIHQALANLIKAWELKMEVCIRVTNTFSLTHHNELDLDNSSLDVLKCIYDVDIDDSLDSFSSVSSCSECIDDL